MDELKSAYIQGLSSRVKALTASKNELEINGEVARKAIRRISHSLRGSGGTYGFPEISELAERVEESSDSNISKALDALLQLLKSSISEHQTSPTKILLIDDDPDIQLIIRRTLKEERAVKLTIVSSGKEAISVLSNESPDVILLDQMLEDTKGDELLNMIKSNDESRDIPIIFLTSKNRPEHLKRFMDIGAKGVITKPFDPLNLYSQIKGILDSD
ncbi:MAG: response regulator [Candidatus Marinimicrobia bacterium]|nr:response regulator [Candidatus Neomarinimicrobiota bacterium]